MFNIFLKLIKGKGITAYKVGKVTGICDGYLLFIRAQSDVESGDIAIVNINSDEETLKRVVNKDNAIILRLENPGYETRIFMGD